MAESTPPDRVPITIEITPEKKRRIELHDDGRVFTVDSDFRVYQKHGRAPIPVLMPDESDSS